MYTFTFPRIGERQYELNTEPSPALARLVRMMREQLPRKEGETKDAYESRVVDWLTDDETRYNSLVRMALAGDHTGIDWFWQGNVAGLTDALNAYVEIVMPKAMKIVEDMQARSAPAQVQTPAEAAPAEPAPLPDAQ